MLACPTLLYVMGRFCFKPSHQRPKCLGHIWIRVSYAKVRVQEALLYHHLGIPICLNQRRLKQDAVNCPIRSFPSILHLRTLLSASKDMVHVSRLTCLCEQVIQLNTPINSSPFHWRPTRIHKPMVAHGTSIVHSESVSSETILELQHSTAVEPDRRSEH